MCAIAGSHNRSEAEKMLELMKHRAPDGTAVIDDGHFVIGMGRLAILDLSSPNLCPHKSSDSRFTLSFNGEIYNYKILREELKRLGHVFKTTSDTEVVAQSYSRWGLNAFEKFNGMFGLAIYDGKRVVLARDIAGEKPVYYTERPFRFASEAKALDFKCEELSPAHHLTYHLDTGNTQIVKYWEPKELTIDPETAEEELEALLKDAVLLRTQSDVPYGLYFSGGIDSTLIGTYHDFKHRFSYQDGGHREQFLREFPKILWHLDYPVNSFSPYGLYQLGKMAHGSGVKVVLSGEGADELFGGYVRYVKPHFNHLAHKEFPSYTAMFQPAENVNEAGRREFYGNLQELLRMGDRMASAWGIENRCPFLDKRMIEFAFSLPHSLKINNLQTKVILANILRHRDPSYRPKEKHGLYCSVNKWLGVGHNFDKSHYLDYQHKILSEIQSKQT